MFNKIQKREIQRFLDKAERGHSSVNLMNVFSAVAYLVKAGCQWSKIPPHFAVAPTTAYYHFRAWSEDDRFRPFLRSLVLEKRHKNGQIPQPSVAIIDSQSVRSALPQSQKGVDGNKRIKGIKRHLAVDSQGNPLEVIVTKANIHDSKIAKTLITKLTNDYPKIQLIKADCGYRSCEPEKSTAWQLQCVKSNYGTSAFIPADGRWVVERTFAWFNSYRRLCRNYEKYLRTATAMVYFASILFILNSI